MQPKLLRVVTRWEIVALSINDVIGSGVYLLPAAAAHSLGAASSWAVLLAGAAVLLVVLCFAEAGSLFDEPGSAYVYARAAFGAFIGFEVGWMTLLARVASIAGLAAGFAQALGYLWPAARAGAGNVIAIVVPIAALTGINLLGVKHGARTAVVLTLGKLVPLLAFIFVGAFAIVPARSFAALPEAPRDIAQTALLLLFAYAGFENTAAAAGEYDQPRRDVPFALLVQIGVVTLLYTAVQVVVMSVLDHPGQSETPLADAMRILIGPIGGLLLTLGAVVSILGTSSNTILAAPRYLYAIAHTGALPSALLRVHPKFRTPHVAILTLAVLALPLALTGSFEKLATLSVIARLVTYFGTAGAVIVLRRRVRPTERSLRLPFGPAIPVAAIAVCSLLLLSATAANLIAGAVGLAIGAGLWLARNAKRGRRP